MNLEKEVSALADLVHFDDKQLSVYSVRIADLLIRCVVEIEGIAKELYESNSGNMNVVDTNGDSRTLYFDTDCLDYLNGLWALDNKQVVVSKANVFFQDKENTTLTPLKNANKRGKCDWKKAYQAVKHNRSKNLEKASVKHLLRALAALYILNVYYKNEHFYLDNHLILPDESLGSSIFSVNAKVCNSRFPDNNVLLDEVALGSIYIIKPTDKGYKRYWSESVSAYQKQKSLIMAAGYELEKDEEGNYIDISYEDIYKIAVEIGGAELVSKIAETEGTAKKLYAQQSHEAVLNTTKIISFPTEN